MMKMIAMYRTGFSRHRQPAPRTRRLLAAMASMLLGACGAAAQPNLEAPPTDNSNQIMKEIGIDQKLDAQVPLNLQFRDEAGHTVRLADYVNTKPVILVLAYYQCPMLCSAVLSGLARSLGVINFDIGREFRVLTVSIDPKETPQLAAAKKANYVKQYGRPGAADGWHFLVGDQGPIDTLAKTVGFRYVYDPASGQYAHAGGIMLLTPQGRVSRYFYGVDFQPSDVRLGLVEASNNRIGSAVDQVLLLCYHYDPITGKYGFVVMRALQAGGILMVLALGVFWYRTIKRDRLKNAGPGIGATETA